MQIASYLTSGSTVAARPGEEIEILGRGFGNSGNILVKWDCVPLTLLERSDNRLKVKIPNTITPYDAAQILIKRPTSEILGPPLTIVTNGAQPPPHPPPSPPPPPEDVSVVLPILPYMVRASSFDSLGNHPAAHSIDGLGNTYWLTAAGQRSGARDWIQVNFDKNLLIDRVDLSFYEYTRRSYSCAVYDRQRNQIVPAFRTVRGKVWEEKRFDPVQTNQITINLNYSNRWTRRYIPVGLYEMKIWGRSIEGEEQPPPPPPPPSPPPDNITEMARQIIDLTNRERAIRGVGSMLHQQQLANAAQSHAKDMMENNYFSHTGLNGSTPGDRITAEGYRWQTYGENIARGYGTAQRVMDGWMASEGHRKNILNDAFTEIGIGYTDGPLSGDDYFVQNFARPFPEN